VPKNAIAKYEHKSEFAEAVVKVTFVCLLPALLRITRAIIVVPFVYQRYPRVAAFAPSIGPKMYAFISTQLAPEIR
jgi:hypothetical protein